MNGFLFLQSILVYHVTDPAQFKELIIVPQLIQSQAQAARRCSSTAEFLLNPDDRGPVLLQIIHQLLLCFVHYV